jgi:hypothetical protein
VILSERIVKKMRRGERTGHGVAAWCWFFLANLSVAVAEHKSIHKNEYREKQQKVSWKLTIGDGTLDLEYRLGIVHGDNVDHRAAYFGWHWL